METYLRDFIYFASKNQARLMSMAKFAYNNAKNACIGHTYFEVNCGYYFWKYYEKDVDPHSKSKLALEQALEL